MIGKIFGRLLVSSFEGIDKNRNRIWLCDCDCGNQISVSTANLNSGHTSSCGCIRLEKFNHYLQGVKTHGLSKHPLYAVWFSMKDRCYNDTNESFCYYGDRNIRVCDDWLNDFLSFYNWAINSGYQQGLTLDRIDNDGNYEPNNCRWATQAEQARNKRNNLRLNPDRIEAIRNDNRSIRAIAEEYEISQSTVWKLKQNN